MKPIIAAIFYLVASFCSSADEPIFPVDYAAELPEPQKTFEEVLELVRKNYYTEISDAALYEAAIRGVLRRISPPGAPELGKFWKPADYASVKDRLLGVQVSIGIRSSYNSADGSLTVSEITADGPSEDILQVHDRIMRIDGKPLKGLTATTVSTMLKGEKDSTVALTVIRDLAVLELKITRKEVPIKNLYVNVMSPEIAHLEIRHTASGISTELKETLAHLTEMQVTKIILDLRGNVGGVFMESLRMAELFLPAKSIMLRTKARDDVKQYVSSNKTPAKFRLVIIADDNTASAAEIFAAALRDHGKAQIVGSKTYGKSVIEKTFTLENDYHVKFIINAMTTPKKKSWQGIGLLPDYNVATDSPTLKTLRKLEPDARLKRDIPLNTAWKLLR